MNTRQKESAMPSTNVHSAKLELRHHTSVVPSAKDILELEREREMEGGRGSAKVEHIVRRSVCIFVAFRNVRCDAHYATV